MKNKKYPRNNFLKFMHYYLHTDLSNKHLFYSEILNAYFSVTDKEKYTRFDKIDNCKYILTRNK